MRQFVVVEGGHHPNLPPMEWDDHVYRVLAFAGCSYSEQELRKWANSVWGTPLDASLERIAADIAKGGWIMMQRIDP